MIPSWKPGVNGSVHLILHFHYTQAPVAKPGRNYLSRLNRSVSRGMSFIMLEAGLDPVFHPFANKARVITSCC